MKMLDAIQSNVLLADKTTFKIGGYSQWYYEPGNPEDVAKALAWAQSMKMPVFVLGKGSNVLVSDEGWPGLTVNIGAAFDAIDWEGNCAVCQSGASLHCLLRGMIDRKLCGIEKLAGIPGSIGGALYMNAGAFGQSIMQYVESVNYLDYTDIKVHAIPRSMIDAGYRWSIFSLKKSIVISARFCFQPACDNKAPGIVDEVMTKRKIRHPLDKPNCGSVFKNPEHTTAGIIIEQCGLKGFSVGGVSVSNKHANFIVNNHNGSAADVRHLIVTIQQEVFKKKQILLEPEVVFVGTFREPLFTHVEYNKP